MSKIYYYDFSSYENGIVLYFNWYLTRFSCGTYRVVKYIIIAGQNNVTSFQWLCNKLIQKKTYQSIVKNVLKLVCCACK